MFLLVHATSTPSGEEPVSHPVLMVHGFVSDFEQAFRDRNLVDDINSLYSAYPGTMFEVDKTLTNLDRRPGDRVFAISFKNRLGPIEAQVEELNRLINGDGTHKGIRQLMRESFPDTFKTLDESKFVVIAHSMGGLTTREYIRTHPGTHGIAKLITLGAPHQGTDLSDLGTVADNIQALGEFVMILGLELIVAGVATFPAVNVKLIKFGVIIVGKGKAFVEFAQELRNQFKVAGLDPANPTVAATIRQLTEGSEFLANLNSFLPNDIDYRLVAGKERLDPFLKTLFRTFNIRTDALLDGDIMVPVTSARGDALAFPGAVRRETVDVNHFALPAQHSVVRRMLVDTPIFLDARLPNVSPPVAKILDLLAGKDQIFLRDSTGRPASVNSFIDIQAPTLAVNGKLFDWIVHRANALVASPFVRTPLVLERAEPSFVVFNAFHTPITTGRTVVALNATNLAGRVGTVEIPIYIVGVKFPLRGSNVPGTSFLPGRLPTLVDIIGNADAIDFTNYAVEHGVGDDPQAFTPVIESMTAIPGIVSGKLGSWDARRLNAVHTLRMLINGSEVQRTTFTIGQPISPALGGLAQAPDQKFFLDIPALTFELPQFLTITPLTRDEFTVPQVRAPPDNLVQPISPPYEILPKSLLPATFNKKVRLTIRYEDADLAADLTGDGLPDPALVERNLAMYQADGTTLRRVPAEELTHDLTRKEITWIAANTFGPNYLLIPSKGPPVFDQLFASPFIFHPASADPARRETTLFAAVLTESARDVFVDMNVLDEAGNSIKTLLADSHQMLSFVDDKFSRTITLKWDGKNETGQIVDDGAYFVKTVARDGVGNASERTAVVVKGRIPPQVRFLNTQSTTGNLVAEAPPLTVSGRVQIMGSAVNPANFAGYTVAIAPHGTQTFTLLPVPPSHVTSADRTLSGIQVTNGLVANWDTTLFEDRAYDLRLTVRDASGATDDQTVFNVVVANGLDVFGLQAVPDPFRVSTTINYTLRTQATVNLRVFDESGTQLLTTLIEGQVQSGSQAVNWDGTGAPNIGNVQIRVEAGVLNVPAPIMVRRIATNANIVAEISSPVQGAALSGTVAIAGSASNVVASDFGSYSAGISADGGVMFQDLFRDARRIGGPGAPLMPEFDSNAFANGSYVFRLSVRDTAGNEKEVLRNVTIDNKVTLTALPEVLSPETGISSIDLVSVLPRDFPSASLTIRSGLTTVSTLPTPSGKGTHRTPWDGTDSGGQPLPSGTYDALLEVEGVQATAPVRVDRQISAEGINISLQDPQGLPLYDWLAFGEGQYDAPVPFRWRVTAEITERQFSAGFYGTGSGRISLSLGNTLFAEEDAFIGNLILGEVRFPSDTRAVDALPCPRQNASGCANRTTTAPVNIPGKDICFQEDVIGENRVSSKSFQCFSTIDRVSVVVGIRTPGAWGGSAGYDAILTGFKHFQISREFPVGAETSGQLLAYAHLPRAPAINSTEPNVVLSPVSALENFPHPQPANLRPLGEELIGDPRTQVFFDPDIFTIPSGGDPRLTPVRFNGKVKLAGSIDGLVDLARVQNPNDFVRGWNVATANAPVRHIGGEEQTPAFDSEFSLGVFSALSNPRFSTNIQAIQNLPFIPKINEQPHTSKWTVTGPFLPDSNQAHPDLVFAHATVGISQTGTLSFGGFTSGGPLTDPFVTGEDGLQDQDTFSVRVKSFIEREGRRFVRVTGTANRPGFGKYRLEFGPGDSPKTFSLIKESMTPVSQPDGTLGFWEVTRLHGRFTLQLSVFDTNSRLIASTRRTFTLGLPMSLAGGQVGDPFNQVTVDFPAGALVNAKNMAVFPVREVDVPIFHKDFRPIGPIYAFQSSPTQLAEGDFAKDANGNVLQPATLTFRATPAELGITNLADVSKVGIWKFNPTTREIALIPSVVTPTTITDLNQRLTITAKITGFTFFFLAEDRSPPEFTVLASPDPIGDGKVAIKVIASKTLATAPSVTVTPFAGSPTTLDLTQEGNAYSGTFTVIARKTPEGTASIEVFGKDLNGNEGRGTGSFQIGPRKPPLEASVAPDPSGRGQAKINVKANRKLRATPTLTIILANQLILHPELENVLLQTGVSSPNEYSVAVNLPDDPAITGAASLIIEAVDDLTEHPLRLTRTWIVDATSPRPPTLISPAPSFATSAATASFHWDVSNDSGTGITKYVLEIQDRGVPVKVATTTGSPREFGPPLFLVTRPEFSRTVAGMVPATIELTPPFPPGLTASLLVDRSTVTFDSSFPFAFNWNSLSVEDGLHLLGIQLEDAQGNSLRQELPIVVQNGSVPPERTRALPPEAVSDNPTPILAWQNAGLVFNWKVHATATEDFIDRGGDNSRRVSFSPPFLGTFCAFQTCVDVWRFTSITEFLGPSDPSFEIFDFSINVHSASPPPTLFPTPANAVDVGSFIDKDNNRLVILARIGNPRFSILLTNHGSGTPHYDATYTVFGRGPVQQLVTGEVEGSGIAFSHTPFETSFAVNLTPQRGGTLSDFRSESTVDSSELTVSHSGVTSGLVRVTIRKPPTYRFQLAKDDPTFTGPLALDIRGIPEGPNGTTQFQLPEPLSQDGLYFFRVAPEFENISLQAFSPPSGFVLDRSTLPSPAAPEFVPTPTETVASLPVKDGVYSWRVTSVDAVGQSSEPGTARKIIVDRIPPPIPRIQSPENGAVTDAPPTLSWRATEDPLSGVGNFQVFLTTSLPSETALISSQTVLSSFTVTTELEDGTYFWGVRSVDRAGNASRRSGPWNFTIDRTPPLPPILDLLPSPTNQALIAISGTAEPRDQIQVFVNSISASQTTSDGAGRFSLARIPLVEGANTITAQATDRLNRTGEISVPRTVVLDTLPPSFSRSETVTLEAEDAKNHLNGIALLGDPSGVKGVGFPPESPSLEGTLETPFVSIPAPAQFFVPFQLGTGLITYEFALPSTPDLFRPLEVVGGLGFFPEEITESQIKFRARFRRESMQESGPFLDSVSVFFSQIVSIIPPIANERAIEIRFTASEPLVENPTVTIQGRPAQFTVLGGLDYLYRFQIEMSLVEGTTSVLIIGRDLAGNAGVDESGFVTIDFTPPEITLKSPLGGERFVATVSTIAINFSARDNLDPSPRVVGKLVQLEDQGSPRGNRAQEVLVASGQRMDPFSIDDGIWLLQVEATDFATNVSSKVSGSFEVIHDIQPPRTVADIGQPRFEREPAQPSTGAVFLTLATPVQLISEDDLIEVGDKLGLGVAFQEVKLRGLSLPGERTLRFDNPSPRQGRVFVSTLTASEEPDGLYALEFLAEDIIGNREEVRIATIAVDNTAPRTQIVLGVPRFVTQEGVRFITSRTPINFEAIDPIVSSVASGVRLTEFSVDGGTFSVLGATASFTLTEGIRRVAFRSMDNLGNTEEPKTVEVRVDDTPPITDIVSNEQFFTDSFGRNYANPFFFYRLDARDPVVKEVASGVAFTRFSTLTLVGTQDVFTPPDPPLPPLRPYDPNNPLFALEEGIKRVDFQSQDNVQNLELLKGATIFVDATPPISNLVVSSPSCARNDGFVVSSKTQLVVDAADPQNRGVASGVFQSFFKENGGRTLSKDFRTGQTSPFFLSPSKPDGFVEVSFFSADNISNVESPKTRTLVLDNTPPTAFFLSPTTSTANPGLCKLLGGTQIKVIGTVTDKGTHPAPGGGTGASFDHFESYTLEFGFGAEPSFFTLITSSVTNRSLESEVLGVWDATSLPEGVYTLRLTAKDCVQNETITTIQVIISRPRIVLSLGRIGNGAGEFNQPSYIAVDPNTQDIWVSDTNNDRIQKFTSSGAFVTQIGPATGLPGPGNSQDKLNKPTGVAVDGQGDVWVADRNNNRVLKFSKAGSFLLELQGTSFNKPHGLALDSQGNIFVADRNNDRIQKFSPQGNLLLTINTGIQDDLNKPQGVLAVDHLHQLYITDRNNDGVLVYSSTGGFIRQLGGGSGSGPGQFNKPDGIALNGLAFAYAADQNNSRIQKFDPFGNVVLIFNMPQNQDEVLNHPGGLATDRDGNLWVADSNNGKVKKFAPEGDLIIIASQDQGAPKDQPAKKFIVKAQGGSVFHAKGAKVDIPAQALPQDMEIIVDAAQNPPKTQGLRVLAGGTRQEVKTIGQAVEYGPSGTQFSQPVTLTLPYDPKALGWAGEDDLTLAYFNPSSSEWEPLQSAVDKTLKVVRTQTTHFSLYAVMAPVSANPSFQLGEVYSFPNPARNGKRPTLHIEAGIADLVNIKIYDVAGELVHETTLNGTPQLVADPNGTSYAYEYAWDQHIPTGVYLYVVTAQKGSEKIRRMGRLSVVR